MSVDLMQLDKLTAADLTIAHYGLLVQWEAQMPGEAWMRNHSAVCDELRRWEYAGDRHVGISDFTPTGPFSGTEHHLNGSTPVRIGHRVRPARKRRWLKQPLLKWEQIEAEES